jgi:hypothetical protein
MTCGCARCECVNECKSKRLRERARFDISMQCEILLESILRSNLIRLKPKEPERVTNLVEPARCEGAI